MDPKSSTNLRSLGSLKALAAGELLQQMGMAGPSGADKTPLPRPADGGEKKPPRAASRKAALPPVLRHLHDPDGTRAAKLTAARRLFDDDLSRRTVCGLQRAGTPNVYLRLRRVEAHLCTEIACHCVMDYAAMAAQMGLVAQYGDGPLMPDAALVAPLSLPPSRCALSAPACCRPALPVSERVPQQHAPSCGTPGPTCTCALHASQVASRTRGARKATRDDFAKAAAARSASPPKTRPSRQALAPMDVNTPERSSPERKTPERRKTPRGDDEESSSHKRARAAEGGIPIPKVVVRFNLDGV